MVHTGALLALTALLLATGFSAALLEVAPPITPAVAVAVAGLAVVVAALAAVVVVVVVGALLAERPPILEAESVVERVSGTTIAPVFLSLLLIVLVLVVLSPSSVRLVPTAAVVDVAGRASLVFSVYKQ